MMPPTTLPRGNLAPDRRSSTISHGTPRFTATNHPTAPAKSSLDGHYPRSTAPQPHPAGAERSRSQRQANATAIAALVKSP
jgi:hypothetical protein